jgi:anti-sigma regulatory factor (Ser/Thr protein kinase)
MRGAAAAVQKSCHGGGARRPGRAVVRARPCAYLGDAMECRRFPRDVAALGRIHEWAESFLVASGFPAEAAFDVDLLIEELFTNMVTYNRTGMEDIEIGLSADGPVVTIRLRDFGVDSFDVTRAPEVDPDMPMEQRRRGGLGLHFVRRMADSLEYDYSDRNSTVTVTKRLET